MNSSSNNPKHTPRIMVVDDDPISRAAVVAKLAGLSVEVVEASDGAEAFGILIRQPCDVAIIDLEMPGMNGLHLLGCIRGHQQIQHMPAIVLTAKCDLRSLEQALISGATSFLTKPLNWAAFGAHIKHIIDISAGVRTAQRVTAHWQSALASVTNDETSCVLSSTASKIDATDITLRAPAL